MMATGRGDGQHSSNPVSYTHLDVYKRQIQGWGGLEEARTEIVQSVERYHQPH